MRDIPIEALIGKTIASITDETCSKTGHPGYDRALITFTDGSTLTIKSEGYDYHTSGLIVDAASP